MSDKPCLFVGGPADGTRQSVPLDLSIVQFTAVGRAFAYREHLFSGRAGTTVRIFITDGMSIGELVERLVDRYPEATTSARSDWYAQLRSDNGQKNLF